MCSTTPVFYKQGHRYECDNEQYLSVTRFISLFKESFDEDAWSWYIAVKLYYIGDFIDKKTNEFYIGDSSIVNHYPLQLWNDQKQGQERKFLIRGSLQKRYLYEFIDKVKYIKDLEILKQRVLDKWHHKKDRACEGGNMYHDFKEKETLFEMFGFVPVESRMEIETKEAKDLTKLVDGPQPELMIYYHPLKLIGQSDKVIVQTKGEIRNVIVRDYKTNEGGIDFSNKFGNKLNYPVNHLDECKFNEYSLQLSVYAWMLEQHGYICNGLYLDWAKIDFETGEILQDENGKPIEIEIPVPYLKNEVEAMIKFHFHKTSGRVRIATEF